MDKMIYKSLAEINKKVGAIQKNRKNEQQGFKFRGIDDVMNELHNLFAEYEVFILPEFMNVETTERTTNKGNVLFYVKATIRFTFMASDGSSVSTVVMGEAMDSGDKATNKAMSIALKYSLLQMFLIPTEEDKDPDASTPPEIKPKPAPQPKKVIIPELEDAMFAVEMAEDIQGLQKVWEGYEKLHTNKQFIDAVKQAKLKIAKNSLK